MSESAPATDLSTEERPVEKPKKKRLRWYLLFPYWFFFFVMFFGFDTLLLRDVPLLLMLIFVFGSLFLIAKAVTWSFGSSPQPKSWRALRLAFIQMLAFNLFGFALLSVMYYRVPPVAISKQTTYLTSPLTPDGKEIDIARAIDERFAPKGKEEDNGFRAVVRLFGPDHVFKFKAETRAEYVSRFCERLELDENEAPQLEFPNIYTFFKQQIEKRGSPDEGDAEKSLQEQTWSLVRKMAGKLWKPDEIPGGEDWLRASAEALDRYGEAVRMPEYYVPPLLLSRNDHFAINGCFESDFHRNAIRCLQCRITYFLAVGEVEKAFDDMETLLRLSGALTRRPVSVQHYLFARATQSVAFSCVRRILEFGDLTKEQTETLRETVRRNRSESSLRDLVFLSRLEGMAWLYLSLFPCWEDDILKENRSDLEIRCLKFILAGWYYFPWNPIFIRFQEKIDLLDAIADTRISRSQYLAIQDLCDSTQRDGPISFDFLEVFFWQGIYRQGAEIISKFSFFMAFNLFHSTCQTHYRAHVDSRHLEIAIALELYRHDHGTYPRQLKELKSGYMDEIPDDPFTDGDPFRYMPTETGDRISGYMLYSVGPNGEDDGGFNRQEKDYAGEKTLTEKDGDDIRIFIVRPGV